MATWNDNAITDVGLELLEQSLTSGKVLTLSRAVVGRGHVESAALKDQTELSSALSDVTVLIAEQVRLDGSSGLQLKLQIRNDGISEACTFKQVGIYASDGETEVLFAIYQDANGEEIPSSIDYPDFMEIFTAVIALSQTYDVNVNVSSLVFITRAELEKRLGDKADVGHTHTVADITDCVEPSNPNLLTNPDFRVNQRGMTAYSSGYSADRWFIEGNKCTVTAGADGVLIKSAIKLDSNAHVFWQKAENPLAPGKYTLSLNVLEVSGVWSARIRTVNASGDYVDSYYTSVLHNGVNKVSVDLSEGEYISAVSVGINKGTEAGNSLKLAWVKLEVGDGATPFVPPDPATELAKCQRYLYVLRGSLLRAGLAEAYSTSYAIFYLYAPASFRTIPSVSFENVVLSSTKDGSVYSEAASIQVRGCNSNAVKLLVNAADSLTIGEQYELSHKPDTTGSIILSAEL
ncbi:MAG: hypothetical protein V8T38_08595 [Oscillospiraceae bacterium]